MSQPVTIFNPSNRPVPYTSSGAMVESLCKADADLDDPVCALSLSQGHIRVLAPRAVVEVANSVEATSTPVSEPVEEVAPEVVETEEAPAQPDDETPSEGEAEEAKPSPRKKSTTQASKES